MAEDWTTWEIVLPSLGYQVLQIHAPARFRKFLLGGTLSGAEWLHPNQARQLINLQDTVPVFFVRQSKVCQTVMGRRYKQV